MIDNRVKIYTDNYKNQYNYYNPLICNYPKNKNVIIKQILFENPNDDDLYTLAIVSWNDVNGANDRLAFRWNITSGEVREKINSNRICIGYPYSPKKEPQWLIIPNFFKYFNAKTFLELAKNLQK
ncbi:MAG: hypothetical protein PHY80_05580 [Rickettsiales bacterium]|nr:hypothetical protein [Rickettsiales bacterium]